MANSTANDFGMITSKVSSIPYPVAATTHIYQYTHVGLTSGGYLVPADDTAARTYVGLSAQEVNNTGADGALYCDVVPPIVEPFHVFNAASPAIATLLGQLVYFLYDNQVALVGTTTYDNVAGRVVEVMSTATAGKVRVDTSQRV
jgi:hypothetical protein